MNDGEIQGPAVVQAKILYYIYRTLNHDFFQNKLPRNVMLTMTRNDPSIGGYFVPKGWVEDIEAPERGDEPESTIPEIGINVNANPGIKDLVATLLHEMLHLEQHVDPNQDPAPGDHDEHWMKRAREVGLEPEGSGKLVNTQIRDDGPLAKWFRTVDIVEPAYYAKPWYIGAGGSGSPNPPAPVPNPRPPTTQPQQPAEPRKPAKPGTRARYVCPVCGLKCWAKRGASFVCGQDNIRMVESG